MTQIPEAVGIDREYETIFILKPDVSRENSETISARLRDVVSRSGGKLTRVENWGRRRLAYPVEKQRRGVYVYFKYIGRGALVPEFERNLRLMDDVIKYQTVRVRDEVAGSAVVVAEEDVKFEHIDAAPDAEEDDSRLRMLGLDEMRPDRGDDDRRGNHGFDDPEEAGDEDGMEGESMGQEDDE